MKSGGTSGIATADLPRAFLALTCTVGPDGRFWQRRTVREVQERVLPKLRELQPTKLGQRAAGAAWAGQQRHPVARARRRQRLFRRITAQPGCIIVLDVGRTTG